MQGAPGPGQALAYRITAYPRKPQGALSDAASLIPRAGVSVALFKGEGVVLVQRGKGIYRGFWSLPGGAIELGETAMEAAQRELREETQLLLQT